jgi:putative ABC transport system permease protein
MLQLDDKIHEFQKEIEAKIAELQQTKQENADSIARLNKLNEALLAEKENEINELKHANGQFKDTMHQRKDVIELQKKQLEDESRKHHSMNEQLNQVEAELRRLKHDNVELNNTIKSLELEYDQLTASSVATAEQLTSERDSLQGKLARFHEDAEGESKAFQQQESALQAELSALESALRAKERELATARAEREEAEQRAIMELDAARQTLANSEKKIKDMTVRMQEQHSQIMWLDESLQKEKKKAAGSGNASPIGGRRSLSSRG